MLKLIDFIFTVFGFISGILVFALMYAYWVYGAGVFIVDP